MFNRSVCLQGKQDTGAQKVRVSRAQSTPMRPKSKGGVFRVFPALGKTPSVMGRDGPLWKLIGMWQPGGGGACL